MSNLRIPGFVQPWEADNGRPARIASALDIMLEGPIGAAAFNNEFGRPGILGYFRSFEQRVAGERESEVRGYHKPIMIAGGLGNVRRAHVEKRPVPPGAPLVLLGGPAMLIGLGGGAASSQGSGAGSEALDFASVQRGNPEMQRRAQQVIDACWAMGEGNPILMVHDVGAGGLSNAVPEVVAPGGGRIDLAERADRRARHVAARDLVQRGAGALRARARRRRARRFIALCRRERCPYAVIGEATDDGRLVVDDAQHRRARRGHADRRPARPPAAHAAQRRAPRGGAATASTAARSMPREALDRAPAAAGDRGQGLPGHDRRPQRRRA